MAYVDKIKKNEVEADIHDARIVAPSEATGKFLKDDFSWGQAGGGEQIIEIDLSDNQSATVSDLKDALGGYGDYHNVQLTYYNGMYVSTRLFQEVWVDSNAGGSYVFKELASASSISAGNKVWSNVYAKTGGALSTTLDSAFDPASSTQNFSITPASGGTKLYKHQFQFGETQPGSGLAVSDVVIKGILVCNDNTPMTSLANVIHIWDLGLGNIVLLKLTKFINSASSVNVSNPISIDEIGTMGSSVVYSQVFYRDTSDNSCKIASINLTQDSQVNNTYSDTVTEL